MNRLKARPARGIRGAGRSLALVGTCALALLFPLARAVQSAQPSVQRVRDLIRLGEVKTAHSELIRILAARPDDAAAHYELGRILMAYDPPLYEEAIEHLTYAAENAPGESDHHLWLARAWGMKLERSNIVTAALGPIWQVKNNFEEAVRLDPKNAPAVVDLFQYYLFAPGIVGGGRDKALEKLRALSKLVPDSLLAHTAQAILALKDGDFDSAAIAFERMAQLAPENAGQYYFQIGLIYLSAVRLEKAEHFLKKALEAKTPIDPPFEILRPNYVRNGFYEKAKFEIENDVRVAVDSESLSRTDRLSKREHVDNPAYPRLLRLVGAIYEQSNHPKLSMMYLERARLLTAQR